MLILSREAVGRVALHAWHVHGQEAYGYLLGSLDGECVVAALPCSRTHDWQTHTDRWNRIDECLRLAEATAADFGLTVVGLYRSEADWDQPPRSGPDWARRPPARPDTLPQLAAALLLVYTPICCRGHSLCRLYRGDQLLDWREDYRVPKGRRADPNVNGRRIHQAWIRRIGPIDYANQDRAP